MSSFFFFNDTATTEIYTLSLHDALPISAFLTTRIFSASPLALAATCSRCAALIDRKSTRLNSSHSQISYAVFCLKKKKIPFLIYITLVSPPRRATHFPARSRDNQVCVRR